MADLKERFDRLFEWLSESEKQRVLEYMENLVANKAWDRIAEHEPFQTLPPNVDPRFFDSMQKIFQDFDETFKNLKDR